MVGLGAFELLSLVCLDLSWAKFAPMLTCTDLTNIGVGQELFLGHVPKLLYEKQDLCVRGARKGCGFLEWNL